MVGRSVWKIDWRHEAEFVQSNRKLHGHGLFRTLELLPTLMYFLLPNTHDMYGTCMLLTSFAWKTKLVTLLFTKLGTTEFMHFMEYSILQLRALLPSLLTGVRLRVTLLWYKPYCFSKVNCLVVMLTRYWSLLQRGYFQPHSKLKAWQLSTQL